jgi:PAS domain S-box-containing protein
MKNDVLLSTGFVLPLIVPAIIEVILILLICATIGGARDSESGISRIARAVSKLDAVYHNATTSALSVLTENDAQILRSLVPIRQALKSDINELKKSTEISSLKSKSADAFSDALLDLSETIETVEGVRKDHHPVEQEVLLGKAAHTIKELRIHADVLRDQLNAKQNGLIANQEGARSKLILLLLAALVTSVVAVIYAFLFARRLSQRMESLHESIVRISMGGRLEEIIPGNDKLSILHSDIQQLSVAMDSARQRERAMIDTAAEIICSLDESLKLSGVNPAVHEVLGYSEDQLLGTNIQSLVHPDDRDMTYNELESIKTKSFSQTFDARLKHFDGEYLFTQWSINWSPDDRSILCVIHDISDRKAAEQLKQDVIAMVSHDLRAPLTSIGVVLDMCMEGAAGTLNDRGKRLVSRAQMSVASLISMIKDLLDIERFEAGGLTLHYENCNATELVQRAVDMVKPEAERKKLSLDISCDEVPFICDGERVNRILINLINNAVKFSKEGKTIYVTGKLLKHRSEDAEVEFQIIDEGPGIPAAKVETIFNKFTQVGTGSEGERAGSGLGLAICKALVQAHQGKIGVKSTEGEGTTFWLRLPQSAKVSSDE